MNGHLYFLTLALFVDYGACNNLCQNQPQGSYVANPDDCSQYYQCAKGVGMVKQCEKDLLWKDENKWCDYPYNVDCGNRHNPHPPPPSICSGLDEVLLADFNDCTKYYHCAKGYIIHKQCESGYWWNDAFKWCDYPENVQCAQAPETPGSSTTKPTVAPTEKPENPKPETCTEMGDTYPDPASCTSFYQCLSGQAIKQNCPAGLHFNPTKKVCDYPASAGCQVK